MKPNETQPELVWFNGRWLLKSVVDRVNAEKAEAKRAALFAAWGPTLCSPRASKKEPEAGKGEAPASGPANPPSEAQAPEPAKPVLSDPIKVEATSVAEEIRDEAIPANAGIPADEKVYGGSGRLPSAVPTGPAGLPALPGSDLPSPLTPDPRRSLPISGQIKPNTEVAEQIGGEATSQSGQIKAEAKSQSRACETESAAEQQSDKATRRSDPPSLCYGVASQIKAEPNSQSNIVNQSVLSGQIKAEAESQSRACGTEEAEQESGEATQIKANANSRGRKGKIAGLPEEIRQALNERLENGEEGKALLDWLNGLPEVKSILASEFEGAPILEQNLSAWRKGGYADWLEREALVEVGLRLQENVAEWKEEGDLDLPQVLGYWLTGQYALATRNMGDLQGHEKWAQLWRIGRGVMRLRQVQEQGEKLKLAEARFAWKQEREAKRAEERAIDRALRAEEKAKRPRRRDFTEEETEEAAQECREIFKPETEEDRAYYYKLRRDAEVADALARGEEPPEEPVPIMEQESTTHILKGRYF